MLKKHKKRIGVAAGPEARLSFSAVRRIRDHRAIESDLRARKNFFKFKKYKEKQLKYAKPSLESIRDKIMSLALDVFGAPHGAEAWLHKPALGLERRRPIDMLDTPEGSEAVHNYLTRILYGVYT